MEVKIPRAAHRPKFQLSDFPKGWEITTLKLMAQGAGIYEVMAKFHISYDLFIRLLKEEPAFSSTIKAGEVYCRAWWETQGRKGLKAKIFQTGLWSMNMQNRFDWRLKREKDENADGMNEKLARIAEAIEGKDG